MTTTRRVALAGISATTLTLAMLSGTASAATPVSSLTVKAATLGSGYQLGVIPNGATLKDATLQFCGKTLHSDQVRSSRLQVQLNPPHQGLPFVSEEVVRYKTGDGKFARADLVTAAKLCVKPITFTNANKGKTTESNVPAHVSGLPAGTIVFKSSFAAADPGQAKVSYTSYDYFMTKGDYLIGVYGGTTKADVDASVKVVKAAAAKAREGMTRVVTMRRRRAAVFTIAALGAATLMMGSAAPVLAADPTSSLLVSPGTVGSGYRTIVFPGGTRLTEPTLEFCGFTLHSDKSRTSRFQVDFLPPHDTKTYISEEIVHYRTGQGKAARADLKAAPKLCPKPRTHKDTSGGTRTDTTTTAHVAGAPQGSIVFKSSYRFVDPGQPVYMETDYDVFLTKGDYLVGVYFSTTKTGVTAGVRTAKAAAAKLAKV